MSENIMATPPKQLSHAEIRKMLAPYATRAWLKRFDEVENKGQKNWLFVVRDFRIDDPAVEIIIEDIVRVLEVKNVNKSVVRAEMESLQAEGKLKLDTPEEEEYWQKRLDEEAEAQKDWENKDNEARMKQRQADIDFLKKKKDENVIRPIKSQEPEKVLETLENATTTEEQTEKEEEKPEEVKPQPQEESKVDNEKANTKTASEEGEEGSTPPPGPKLKSVEIDGEQVYDKDKKTEPKPKLDTLGLPQDAIKRLNDTGVYTVDDLKNMDQVQAKRILGDALYTKHKAHLIT